MFRNNDFSAFIVDLITCRDKIVMTDQQEAELKVCLMADNHYQAMDKYLKSWMRLSSSFVLGSIAIFGIFFTADCLVNSNLDPSSQEKISLNNVSLKIDKDRLSLASHDRVVNEMYLTNHLSLPLLTLVFCGYSSVFIALLTIEDRAWADVYSKNIGQSNSNPNL